MKKNLKLTPLNLHSRGPSDLTNSSNDKDKSSDLDRLRNSSRGLKAK